MTIMKLLNFSIKIQLNLLIFYYVRFFIVNVIVVEFLKLEIYLSDLFE